GLEVHRGPGEGDLPIPDPDRLDPAKALGARERRDPAVDEGVERHQAAPTPASAGGRGARSTTGPQPAGSASSAASPAWSSPAPRPTASAIRALGPDRCPARIAPARTHVAPPPGNA